MIQIWRKKPQYGANHQQRVCVTVLTAIVFVFAGQGCPSERGVPARQGTGNLRMHLVYSQPVGVDSLRVVIRKALVKPSGGDWLEVRPTATSLDILRPRGPVVREIINISLVAGQYDAFKLVLGSDSALVKDGATVLLAAPPSGTSVSEIVSGKFAIEPGQSSWMALRIGNNRPTESSEGHLRAPSIQIATATVTSPSQEAAFQEQFQELTPLMYDFADAIVVGRVLSVSSSRGTPLGYQPGDRVIISTVSIAVGSYLKPPTQTTSTLEIRVLGGQIGEMFVQRSDQAVFTVGEKFMAALEWHGTEWHVLGGPAGKLEVP